MIELLIAQAIPSVRQLVAFVVLLVVAGVAWKFLGPHVAEPFRSIIVVAIVLVFALMLLAWAGLF